MYWKHLKYTLDTDHKCRYPAKRKTHQIHPNTGYWSLPCELPASYDPLKGSHCGDPTCWSPWRLANPHSMWQQIIGEYLVQFCWWISTEFIPYCEIALLQDSRFLTCCPTFRRGKIDPCRDDAKDDAKDQKLMAQMTLLGGLWANTLLLGSRLQRGAGHLRPDLSNYVNVGDSHSCHCGKKYITVMQAYNQRTTVVHLCG